MKINKYIAVGLSLLMLNFTACELQPVDNSADSIPPVEETKKEDKKEEEKKEDEKKEEPPKIPEKPAPFDWETIDYSTPKAVYEKIPLSITAKDGGTYTISGNTITLNGKQSGQLPDEYTIKGYFAGQIISNLKDNEIILDGAYLENTNVPPVLCNKKAYITAKSGTTSYIVANGTSEQKYGAIHSEKGLELGGKGKCYIVGNIYHGVKASNMEMKGSGTYYIQGNEKGAAINCNNFEVKTEKTFTCYLINSKNGIKADETVNISSGTFYFGNVDTCIKTDKAEDDGDTPKTHSVTLLGGTINYNTDDVEQLVSTDTGKYQKADATVITELTNVKKDAQ